MKHLGMAAALLLAGAMPALADDDLPNHKPGLWEIDKDGNTARYCIDAELDTRMKALNRPVCSRLDAQRSNDMITLDATCTNQLGGTVTHHTVVTGSFDSAYTLTNKATVESTNSQPVGVTTKVVAKWLGPCEEDQKPGDVIVSGVKALNILEYEKRRLEFERQKSSQPRDTPLPPQ